MPFLVLEALGSELSVILAIWSRPTMRSTVGYMKDDISLWAPSGVLHYCHKPEDQTVKMMVKGGVSRPHLGVPFPFFSVMVRCFHL